MFDCEIVPICGSLGMDIINREELGKVTLTIPIKKGKPAIYQVVQWFKANKIKKARSIDVAKSMGLQKSNMSAYETGKVDATSEVVITYIHALQELGGFEIHLTFI